MSKQALVSVIIPVYNCENYIEKCIESVLLQSYENFEMILIDDGSPDNSGAICDKYAEKDSRVRVIHKSNGGVSSARKKGIENSTSAYISFIDSDDYIEPDYLEKLMNAAQKTDSDVVCCNCIDEGITGQPNICIEKEQTLDSVQSMLDCYFSGQRFAYVIWGKVFKKSIAEKLEFVKIRYTEDTHMMLQAFTLSKKISLIPYSGYHYIAQPDSAMAVSKLFNVCMDSLVTTEFLLKLSIKTGEKYAEIAKKKAVTTLFNTLSACAKQQKADNDSNLRPNGDSFLNIYSMIEPKYFFSGKIKGILALSYKKMPKATLKIIKIYQSLKNNK